MAPLAALALGAALCLCAAAPPQQQDEEELVVAVELDAPAGQRRYRLDAFGQRLRLQLEPDSSFVAPGLAVRAVGTHPPRHPDEEEEEAAAGGLERCFYSGAVHGEPGSVAALSLCAGGLRGAFYLRGYEYRIQPAANPPLHRLRRRPRPLPAARPAAAARCGVAEPAWPPPPPRQHSAPRAGTASPTAALVEHPGLEPALL